MTRPLATSVGFLLLAWACASEPGRLDASTPADASAPPDSGTGARDAGAPPDAGRGASDAAAPSADAFGERHGAMATHFGGMGTPGGCGVPPSLVDSQDYVALDVEYTPYPQPYTMDPRPIANPQVLGAFDNGLNCGRWVEVTIGEYCTGNNGGADGRDFCTNGQWVADELSGAKLDMIVADSCQDQNGWCRDDRYHLDLNTPALQHFQKNGDSVGDSLAAKWNNRKITWRFEPAPQYSGDVKIYFVPQAQKYWPAILITHLPNGLHRVERNIQGTWKEMPMLHDNGQVYALSSSPFQSGEEPPYQIRLYDAADQPINGGRSYSFDLPCSNGCPSYTEVSYSTSP